MTVGALLVVLSDFIDALQDYSYSLALPGIAIFIFGFELGPGPIYYIAISELYPQAYRGRAMSVIAPFNWIGNIIITLFYPSLVDVMEEGYVFTIFAVLSALVTAYVILFIPETKGKSLEQISTDSADTQNSNSSFE